VATVSHSPVDRGVRFGATDTSHPRSGPTMTPGWSSGGKRLAGTLHEPFDRADRGRAFTPHLFRLYRLGAGEAREAPQSRQAGSRIGGAATRVGRRPERWTGVVARRGAVRWHPARCRIISGAWDELTAGTPGDDAPVGVTYHPANLCRTAGYVTRTSGGVGGGRP
jgi:hypothetical protein